MDINHCCLSGRITRNGELKATQVGTAVLVFGLAFNDRKRDASGNWTDYPNFIDCVVYGKFAEAVASYATKGAKAFVSGKLRFSSWEKDGRKRSKIELIVTDLDIPRTAQAQQAAQPAYSVPNQANEPDLYDEEIPF